MHTNFTSVTEIPGGGATKEQIAMARTRYDLVASMGKDKDVLELACGSGYGLGYIAQFAKTVVGGDIDKNLVEIANKNANERYTVYEMSAEQLPFKNESFDVIALLEAIYYLDDCEKFLYEAKRVLRPGGKLIVCFPNKEWPLFNPSPYSKNYFSYTVFNNMLAQAGFKAEIRFGFKHEINNKHTNALDFARKIAVKFNLIPKSFALKDMVKRLFFGKLIEIPNILTEEHGYIEPLVSLEQTSNTNNYRVIYTIAY